MNLRRLKDKASIIITLKSPVEDAVKKLSLNLHTPVGLKLNMIAFANVQRTNNDKTVCGNYFSLKNLSLTQCDAEFNCDQCIFSKNHHYHLIKLKSLVNEI